MRIRDRPNEWFGGHIEGWSDIDGGSAFLEGWGGD